MNISIAGVSVMLAMPVFDTVNPRTVQSLLATQAACVDAGLYLDIELNIGSTVFHCRSKAAHRFLQGHCDKFFMIDSDMVWTPDDFFRLVALSTKMDCVCSTYPARSDPIKFFLGPDTENTLECNEYGCMPIGGAGLGFTIVDRTLVQKLADKAPKIRFEAMPGESVAKIFRFDEPDGVARGEDMAFFDDLRELGYRVNLDPSLTLGHIGAKEYRANILDYLERG
jgi:hypothetical protein